MFEKKDNFRLQTSDVLMFPVNVMTLWHPDTNLKVYNCVHAHDDSLINFYSLSSIVCRCSFCGFSTLETAAAGLETSSSIHYSYITPLSETEGQNLITNVEHMQYLLPWFPVCVVLHSFHWGELTWTEQDRRCLLPCFAGTKKREALHLSVSCASDLTLMCLDLYV